MNIYETITQTIVDAIERKQAGEFTLPWHRADGKALSNPVNAISKKAYRGSNILQLWATAMQRGYGSNIWATYKQWESLGGQVRKGEKSTLIAFYKKMTRAVADSDDAAETPTNKTFMMAKAYCVFNADQVDGIAKPVPLTEEQERANLVSALETTDHFVSATKADIRTGAPQAYYSPGGDFVNMPERDLFTGSKTSSPTECYYSTLCHELTHWTGAPKRLDRHKLCAIGKRTEYAFEELVAELGAAFLCSYLGISNTPRVDHAAYIANWLTALKSDSKFIFQAASQAQQALDYLQVITESIANVEPMAEAA